MKNKCYWLVEVNDADSDMFWYTNENYEVNDIVTVNGILYRVISKDVF